MSAEPSETAGPAHLPHGQLGYLQLERAPSPEAGPLLWFHVDDLDAAGQSIKDAGCQVLEPPSADVPSRQLATISDPEGNVVGLVQYRPAG